jgi:hypothetical protein
MPVIKQTRKHLSQYKSPSRTTNTDPHSILIKNRYVISELKHTTDCELITIRFLNLHSTHSVGGIIIIIIIITYLLTPWSRAFLEKLTDSQLVKNSPHFKEPEGSLPHSQQPVTRPYPEPARSNPQPYIPLPADAS